MYDLCLRIPGTLGREDPLEEEMATHSSILAWKISWTEEPGGLQFMWSQRVGHDWATNTYLLTYTWYKGFSGGSAVKNPPAMQKTQETQVWSLGWEDPLEEGMAICSSIAWRIPRTGEPGRLQSPGSQRVRHNRSDWACTCAYGTKEVFSNFLLVDWIYPPQVMEHRWNKTQHNYLLQMRKNEAWRDLSTVIPKSVPLSSRTIFL